MPKDRISFVTAALIVALAAAIDLVQLLLTVTVVGAVASLVLGGIMGFVLWLIFLLHGVKYSGAGGLKKIAASFGTTVFELVPFLDSLPLITIGAVLIIRQTKKEDAEKRAQMAAEIEKTRREQMTRMNAVQQQVQAANDNQMLVEESLAA